MEIKPKQMTLKKKKSIEENKKTRKNMKLTDDKERIRNAIIDSMVDSKEDEVKKQFKESSINLINKKNFLLKTFKQKLEGLFTQIPQNVLKLPILNVIDALEMEYDGTEIKLVDLNKKIKRESTVSLTFGEEYTYDGKTFLDSKGKVKNESLDQNLKDLLKNAKKIADRMGKDMSLFIE